MQILPEVPGVLILPAVCQGGRIAFYIDPGRVLDDLALLIVSGNVLKYSHIAVQGAGLHGLIGHTIRKQLYVYIFRTDAVAVIVILKRILHGDGTRLYMVDDRKPGGGVPFDLLLVLSSKPARIQRILRGNARCGRSFVRFHRHVFRHLYGRLPLVLCIRPDRSSIVFIQDIIRFL